MRERVRRALEKARAYFVAKQTLVDEYGLVEIAYLAIMRRLARLGFHLFLVELGDDNPNVAMPRLPPGYTARATDLEELWPWVDQDDNGLSEEFLRGAIARGDRCVANFFNGELVGYGFVTQVGAPATNQLDVVIDDRLIYRYKGWTHPDHRRKHLSHARGRLNRQFFPLTGGRRTVDFVAVDNVASRKKHADVHPTRLGYCGFVRVLGHEFPFTSRGPRRSGFRLARRPQGGNAP
jgi:hypothetical protein